MQLLLLFILLSFNAATFAEENVNHGNGYLPNIKPITNGALGTNALETKPLEMTNTPTVASKLIVRDPFAATTFMVKPTQSTSTSLSLPNIRLKALGLKSNEKVAILEIDGFNDYLVVKPNQLIDLHGANDVQTIKIINISTQGVEVSTGSRKVLIR